MGKCEYSDVHVMWEMLSNPSGSGVRDGRRATAGKGAAEVTRRDRALVGRKAAAISWSRLALLQKNLTEALHYSVLGSLLRNHHG